MSIPSIGRIVHYNLTATDIQSSGGENRKQAPAMIVHVNKMVLETTVNLKVFTDGPNNILVRDVVIGTHPGQYQWPVIQNTFNSTGTVKMENADQPAKDNTDTNYSTMRG